MVGSSTRRYLVVLEVSTRLNNNLVMQRVLLLFCGVWKECRLRVFFLLNGFYVNGGVLLCNVLRFSLAVVFWFCFEVGRSGIVCGFVGKADFLCFAC